MIDSPDWTFYLACVVASLTGYALVFFFIR
jgi:hypothetical protein